MQIKLVMNEEHAEKLIRALEIIARIGMCQFAEMVNLLVDCDYHAANEIENYLKEELQTGCEPNSSYSINSDYVPEECKVAWDAYQHLRRELSWARDGKDWRTDERKWPEMMQVNYDTPMKASGLDGAFKTERCD